MKYAMVVIGILVFVFGCESNNKSLVEFDTDTDTSAGDGDTDADADGDTDADSDTDADGDTDADSDTDSDVDSDTDSDGDTDGDADGDADGDSDSDVDGGTLCVDNDSDWWCVPLDCNDSDSEIYPGAEEDSDNGIDDDCDDSTDEVPGVLDSDDDGLSDDYELENGTDPFDADSDDDGVSDFVEEVAGTDPNDPDSNPSAEGNFYFLVPYLEDPDPPEDTLTFATDIQMADLFFLVDTTGSMGGEINNLKASLSSYIIPEVESIIPDVWFGVGRFDDYPYGTYGYASSGDVVFQLVQRTTESTTTAQTAVNTLNTHYGGDGPESDVPAMYATATGEGFGTYLAAQTACASDEVGYPCFRNGAVPIIMLITDADFHNGPGNVNMYSGVVPTPPTYAETVTALNAIHAKVLSIVSGTSGLSHCTSISTDTGAVDAYDDPLVFTISGDGTGMDSSVVNAVSTLATSVPMDLSAEGRDDLSDTVDATIFIDYITPHNETTSECTGGLTVDDLDDDSIDDIFLDVLPGTPVCFDIIPAMNTTVEPTPEPQLFMAYIDVTGDSVTVLDTREVYFLVPPDEPLVE